MMRIHRFGQVVVEAHPTHITTIFPDGRRSEFHPPVADWQFKQIARMFGYSNVLQFGLEQDLTHSWLAAKLGHPHSLVVWGDAHGQPQHPKQPYDDEEHLVTRLQHYINTGKLDDDYGVLRYTFGDDLPKVGAELWMFLGGNS